MIKLQYEVKRSKRKSICIRILDDNRVVVSCPNKTSIESIEEFLELKSKWIERHLAENSRKNRLLEEIILYKQILVAGKAVPFKICKSGNNFLSDDGVCVKSLKGLQNLYVSKFGNEFALVINQVCVQTGLSYVKYSFRDYKSRWGCCDRTRELKFNWKLLMLSEEIRRYVIIHELCHTVHMNHSSEFYKLVESIMPEYKSVKRELELYSRIIKLY